jgi:TM2 domain-containing membrane protein YozV
MSCGVALNPGSAKIAGGKSKVAAGLLGIFLGAFGVHNFYLGYTTKAVIQLVCTIVGFVLSCLGIGVFVVAGISIWGLVEGIMILTGSINVDGQGNPLSD